MTDDEFNATLAELARCRAQACAAHRTRVDEIHRDRRRELRIGYTALVVALVIGGVLLWLARQPV